MKPRALAIRRRFAAAALAAICGAAAAQTYPAKPIRFLLPFAPGAIGDLTARLVAQKMSENIGQQVLVDNRPGAGMIVVDAQIVPFKATPEQTRELMRSEIARWRAVIERANIPRQ